MRQTYDTPEADLQGLPKGLLGGGEISIQIQDKPEGAEERIPQV